MPDYEPLTDTWRDELEALYVREAEEIKDAQDRAKNGGA